MSGDIAPGNLVVCVNARPIPGTTTRMDMVARLKEGRTYLVVEVYYHGARAGVDIAGLIEPCDAYCASRFHKLNDEPDNAELVEKIKACKPMKTGVPA